MSELDESPDSGRLSARPPFRTVVLHALAPALYGGLESVIQALTSAQRADGHEVHAALIVSPSETDHPLAQQLRTAGVAVHIITVSGRQYAAEARGFAQLCRAVKPGVVHTHGYRSDIIEGAVARWLGIPRVSTVHGFVRLDRRSRLYERIQRHVLKSFDAVIAVSRPLVEELSGAGVPRERVHLIPNAWSGATSRLSRADAREALHLQLDVPTLGWVGRLSPEKGADVLLHALEYLNDIPALQVAFIGDGREKAALQGLVPASGGHRISWHGVLADAGRYFSAFDVFVLSSRTEGTPIVLFEAMAADVPVVATRVGGVPDVVGTAEAELVPSEDPRALADALRRVLANPGLSAQRALRARMRLEEEYRLDNWVASHTRLYAQIALARPPR